MTEDTSSSPSTSLDSFFDQSADSAFGTARFGGYVRTEVDAWVAETERRSTSQQQRIGRLEQQVRQLTGELEQARSGGPAESAETTPDTVLAAARSRAQELVLQAEQERDRHLHRARAEAEEVVGRGQRDAEDLRLAREAELADLRERLERDVSSQLTQARAEAEALLAQATQHATELVAAAEQSAAQLSASTEREVAAARQEAEAQLSALRAAADQRRAEILREAADEFESTRQQIELARSEHQIRSEEALARLAEITSEATRVRTEALADAEDHRARALRSTEDQIATAQQQSRAGMERELARHQTSIDEIQREIALLQQRRRSIVGQLSELSALVSATAGQFGDSEEDLAGSADQDPDPVAEEPLAEDSAPQSAAEVSATEETVIEEPEPTVEEPEPVEDTTDDATTDVDAEPTVALDSVTGASTRR